MTPSGVAATCRSYSDGGGPGAAAAEEVTKRTRFDDAKYLYVPRAEFCIV